MCADLTVSAATPKGWGSLVTGRRIEERLTRPIWGAATSDVVKSWRTVSDAIEAAGLVKSATAVGRAAAVSGTPAKIRVADIEPAETGPILPETRKVERLNAPAKRAAPSEAVVTSASKRLPGNVAVIEPIEGAVMPDGRAASERVHSPTTMERIGAAESSVRRPARPIDADRPGPGPTVIVFSLPLLRSCRRRNAPATVRLPSSMASGALMAPREPVATMALT